MSLSVPVDGWPISNTVAAIKYLHHTIPYPATCRDVLDQCAFIVYAGSMFTLYQYSVHRKYFIIFQIFQSHQ